MIKILISGVILLFVSLWSWWFGYRYGIDKTLEAIEKKLQCNGDI